MEFGVQFFPSVGPDQKSAEQYWGEALQLTQHAEQLGYASVRTVEHYFHPYGGYSPDPLIFLSAAAAMTQTIRLITGAVLPVFNNPLKLAGQIGMVDAISKGRVEIGFARAFLPHEFARFGISMDESRARFDEGLEQVTPPAGGGKRHREGPLPQLRKGDVAAAPDAEAAAAVLDRRAVDRGIVRECRPARPSPDGHSAGRRADGASS